jgi:hypothetical protein
MVVVADRANIPQPRGRAVSPEHLKKALEAPCSFHGGQVRHILKDYATMRGYIHSTLGPQGRAQKPTPKAGDPTEAALEEDAEFPDRCLMIFRGS